MVFSPFPMLCNHHHCNCRVSWDRNPTPSRLPSAIPWLLYFVAVDWPTLNIPYKGKPCGFVCLAFHTEHHVSRVHPGCSPCRSFRG